MHFDEMINKIRALLQESNTCNLLPNDIQQLTNIIDSFCTETSSPKCKKAFRLLTTLENPIYMGMLDILMAHRPNHLLDYREIEALALGLAKILAQKPKDRLKVCLALQSAFKDVSNES